MKFKTIFLVISIIFVLALGGCEDFGDMNENPNAPTSVENTPELLLTGIQRQIFSSLINNTWSQGNLMAQYLARIVFTTFDMFTWGTNSSDWNNFYLQVRSCQTLYDFGEKVGNTSYQGVSLILKSWMFQILTDLWGEVPYTQASKAKLEQIYYPAYDTQETIYMGIISDLDKANTLLSVPNRPSIKGDLIYNGDIDKWNKLANSLKLRALIRLTNVDGQTDINVADEIRNIVSNPSQYPLLESTTDNATLTYTTTPPNVHPRTAPVYRVGSWLEWRMSETIEKVCEAYDDPRLHRWFDPTDNSVEEGVPDWSGMINGMVDGDAYVYKGGSAFLSTLNFEFFESPNELEGIIMLSSEVKFILAEAAVRYPSVANIIDAKSAYEDGIQLSFDYWKVEMPEDYLTRTSSDPDVTAPVSFDGEIETIITQKWLSLFYTDYQGFCEFKRTTFPKQIKPGPDAQLQEYPSRFRYPTSEQALNKVNYETAIERQGPDEYSNPVWWEGK